MKLNDALTINDFTSFLNVPSNNYSDNKKNLNEIINNYSFNKKINKNWKECPYNRISFINLAIKNYQNPSYLEIGTHHNTCFDQIEVSDKIGVDPKGIGDSIIKSTSDKFFESNDKYYDVIFIDGLHTYSQVRKDAINSLKFLKTNGLIFFHDMIPLNWLAECPDRIQVTWNGDVWKVGFELSKISGLEFHVALADHGIGILYKSDDNYKVHTKEEEYSDLRYKNFIENNSIDYLTPEDAFIYIKSKL